ncbi:hypothetical protein BOX15_Mlig020081g4, partial [Macrostomum lignano]
LSTATMGAQMSLIAPNLYLGSWQGANNAKLLEENGVRHILTIFDARFSMPACVKQRNHLQFLAADSCQQDIRQFFQQSNDFIHSGRLAGEAVFVHCMAGVSRSATLIIAYLASVTDLPWDTVLSAVRAAKHDVAPNFHFRAQLRLWQNDGGLEAERARLLEKFGPWQEDRDRLLKLAEICAEFERTGYWRGELSIERRGNAFFAVHHLPDAEDEVDDAAAGDTEQAEAREDTTERNGHGEDLEEAIEAVEEAKPSDVAAAGDRDSNE